MSDARDASVGATWDYRPHLDGLRAVAVYLVVVFHAGADRFAGGFIGVDVFFVLSGYLVTQILLRDLRRSDRIGFRRFYARRFRRLLPAAFVALIVTAVAFSAVASPAEVADAIGSFRASFLYVANWYFIDQQAAYFAADIQNSPAVHFWSLAIEEQFYLAWPPLLWGLVRITRARWPRWWVPARAVVGAAALASAAGALLVAQDDLSRAYYGTDTRAYQLLAGAFLALSPKLFELGPRAASTLRRIAPLVAGILVVLGTSAVDVAPVTRGVLVVAVVSLLIVAVENADGGIVRRGLSLAPVTYLGRISYGTYLWHWPIIVIASHVTRLSSASTTAISCLVATGIASLSYQVLERPIRESATFERYRYPVIGAGLAVSIVAGMVVVPAILERDGGGSGAAAAATVGMTPVPADLDWRSAADDRPDFPDCLDQPVTRCVVVEGDGPRIMLIGDSHANMYLPAFAAIAEDASAELVAAVRAVCPWQAGLHYAFRQPAEHEACRARQADWYDRVVPETDPDILVLVTRPLDDPVSGVTMLGTDARSASYDRPGFVPFVVEHAERTLRAFVADGRRAVIVEPIPITADDPVACLSASDFIEACRYVTAVEPTPLEEAYRELAASLDGVWALDADRLACPFAPICDPVVDGLIVTREGEHLTGAYAATLADELERFLRDNGILG